MTHTARIFALSTSVLLACSGDSAPKAAPKTDPKAAPPTAPEAKPEPKAEAKQEAKADAKAEAKAEGADAGEEGSALPPPATPPSSEPGPAFFAVDKKGIVRLDKGKFTAIKGGPDALIKNLHVAADGALWVLGFETIYRLPKLDGDSFKEIAKGGFQETGSIDDFHVVSDKDIWTAGFGGVAHWDGKGWTKEEKAAIGAGDDLLNGIAIDAEGKVWVSSSNRIHVKDKGAWSTLDLSKVKSGQLFMEGLERAADGTIFALSSSSLIKLGPGAGEAQAVKLGGGSFPSYSDMAIGPDGTIAVRNLFDLVIASPGGGKAKVWKKKDYMSEDIRSLAVDASGRVWIASKIGAAILGPGDAKVEWPSGTVPELAGEIETIAVVGTGPAELPAVGPVKTGGLTGKILKGGSGVANLEIELCPSPGMMFSKSPCADSSVKFSGKTDDQGVWKFDGVPLGVYGIAIKSEGKWKITLGTELGGEMKEGQVYDVGSLALD